MPAAQVSTEGSGTRWMDPQAVAGTAEVKVGGTLTLRSFPPCPVAPAAGLETVGGGSLPALPDPAEPMLSPRLQGSGTRGKPEKSFPHTDPFPGPQHLPANKPRTH